MNLFDQVLRIQSSTTQQNSIHSPINNPHIFVPLSLSASSQHPWTPTTEKQTNMPTISNFYTVQDVAQHSTKDDCWIIVDGKVYDVTQYLDDHPGGDDVIIAATGRDATEDFEDAGHSKTARELMEQYYVGELDTSPLISTKKSYSEMFKQLNKQYLAVSVAVVGISVVVGFLYLRKK